MSRLPIRMRLSLAFALAMTALLAALGGFLYFQLRASLDEQLDAGLRAHADAASALVARGGELGDAGALVEEDESVTQVVDADGTIRDASPSPYETRPLLADAELARARAGPLSVARRSVSGAEDGPFRLLAGSVDSAGEPAVVVVGSSLEDRDDALSNLLSQLLVGGPVALLIATLAGYLLAGAILRPVEAMSRRAAEISSETTGRRLPLPPARDEIHRLGETLNAMLARLEAGLARERRFVADASHELRTPLALLRTELELALRHPREPDELRGALRSAGEEVERLTRLAEDLLVLARADEGRLPLRPESIPAETLLTTVAGRFEQRAAEQGRALETAASGGPVLGDRLRLEQALGNLVDNALRHGAGAVTLEAAPTGNGTALRVSDEGDGFPPGFLPEAFDRFTRGDEARARGGAGLGLAIVGAIARAHGGRAHAANRSGGGAIVTIELPGDS